ncbi:MAG: twin-arginine translocation signal domain-containing protein, partial [Acidobacteria bacterium]|nr:twin-arginine translocation signal domain-containing protein [Acidobacteriota bacterium]
MKKEISRREFMARITAAGFGALVASTTNAWGLEAITNQAAYPKSVDWERSIAT